MKKNYLFLAAFAAFCAVITLAGCKSGCKEGSGKQVTETRKVTGFTKVDISGAYKVIIKQDTAASLSVTADDNLMEYIKSDVSGDRLTIKSEHRICTSGQFTLNISVRDLESVKASGDIEISSPGKLNVKDLELNLSGSTKVALDLSAANVNTRSSGVTEINLKGQASLHNIKISGTGKLEAFDFIVAKYRVETSGASHCKINVLNQLDVNSSGASEIEYRGNPGSVNENKSGASSLKKVD